MILIQTLVQIWIHRMTSLNGLVRTPKYSDNEGRMEREKKEEREGEKELRKVERREKE